MAELLAPAGSLKSLRAAVNAGADAVYIGGGKFSARAYADNPGELELIEGIEYCHLRGRKLYLTVNTLVKERELQRDLTPFLLPFYEQGADAVLVQDLGVLRYLREHFPGLALHASTQMSVTTAGGARFLAGLGVSRVVTARELSLDEIRKIVKEGGTEVEVFIHGAMCYCYSGRCLMSSSLGGRSGNRGRCAQPCRLYWHLEEESENREQCLLSMKDLCTLDILPDLIDAGISSFKIEGRMKSPEYTASVVSVYRQYLDLYEKEGRRGYRVDRKDREFLRDLFNRGEFSGGYFFTHGGTDMLALKRPDHKDSRENREKALCGRKIQERYLKENSKVKINGELRISAGIPAILKLWPADEPGLVISSKGEIPAPARTSPLSKEEAERQIRRLGDTDFAFDNLSVQLEDGLFLPLRALNALRRDALDTLEKRMLEDRNPQFGESPVFREEKAGRSRLSSDTGGIKLQILVSFPAQLSALLEWVRRGGEKPEILYLDSLFLTEEHLAEYIEEIRKQGICFLISLPPVMRGNDAALFEKESVRSALAAASGYLLHTADQLAALKDSCPDKLLIAEDCLYSCNTEAQDFLRDQGVSFMTLPAELNAGELSDLCAKDTVLNIYGYQPLMQTAQCVKRDCKSSRILYLTDRRGVRFPVLRRCNVCCNTIYNSVPLWLGSCQEEIQKLHPAALRLSFTVETAKETKELLDLYRSVFKEGAADTGMGTRAHFKRRVE